MGINDRADIAAAAMPAPQPSAEIDEGGGGAISLGISRQIGGRENSAVHFRSSPAMSQ